MKIENLHGIWNLVSIYGEAKDGKRNYYYGEDAIGRLTYLPDGYMTVFLMRPGRGKLSGGIEGTPEETERHL